jgi:hypothetical protein
MFGSGRAVLSMRQSYRDDMQAVKKITDFKYVRFHAIMDDDIGVYDEDAQGNPVYNFSYIDQIYDGLLANGVRPFVEISFMPKEACLAPRLPRLLVQADRLSAQGLGGTLSSSPSPNTSSSATASMKSRSGTSKSGTSPTSISGLAAPPTRPTSSCTTTPPAPSKASTRASASEAPLPRRPPGSAT